MLILIMSLEIGMINKNSWIYFLEFIRVYWASTNENSLAFTNSYTIDYVLIFL